jgi:hypothetical protein
MSTPNNPRRKVRGFDWRMTIRLKDNIKAYCKENGMSYTEFLERACTLYLYERNEETK